MAGTEGLDRKGMAERGDAERRGVGAGGAMDRAGARAPEPAPGGRRAAKRERTRPHCFVLGCIGCAAAAVVLTAVAGGGCALFVFAIMKSSDVYKISLETVRADKRVKERIGEPLSDGWYVSGTINKSGPSGNAKISYPVHGPDGSATVRCEAFRTGGEWVIEFLAVEFETEEATERIVIIDRKGEGDFEVF